MNEGNIVHRGQWEGQNLPNSFESFRLYKTGLEADVMLLNDGKTLAVAHTADLVFRGQPVGDEEFENKISSDDFAKIEIAKGEDRGGAAPFFREYVQGCYDRGISATFEIRASKPEMAARTARRAVETIEEMKNEGAFVIQGKESSEFLEQMAIHSFSAEAITEAKKALEETGLLLRLGFTWLSSFEHVSKNAIAATALRYYRQGDNWEQAGLRIAKELGCNFIFFVEPSKITAELVAEAHKLGLELYVFIRANENTSELKDKLISLNVDKLLY